MPGIAESLRQGSIYLKPAFLTGDEFSSLQKKLHEYEYEEGYQPYKKYYGNRYQAYPCYHTNDIEIADPEFFNLFKDRHQECLEEKITNFRCVIRKAITDEVKRSAINTKYGMVHRDTWGFASILHFVQSYNGGTAFFEDVVDRTPDIEVSAYPNRLIMYNGRRWHSPCTDFTFDERYVLVSFFECSGDE